MMQGDQGAQFANGVRRKESVECSLGTEPGALPGKLFHLGHKLRIERHAGLAERHERNRGRSFRSWRQDAGASPGGFAPRVTLLEDGYAQTDPRKFQSDGAAD